MSGEGIGFRLFRATGLAFAIRPKDGVARQGRRGGFHCCCSKVCWNNFSVVVIFKVQYLLSSINKNQSSDHIQIPLCPFVADHFQPNYVSFSSATHINIYSKFSYKTDES